MWRELWARLGVGSQPKPYPSIALGVFEATPLEIATAYTIFPNMGRRTETAPHHEGDQRRVGRDHRRQERSRR